MNNKKHILYFVMGFFFCLLFISFCERKGDNVVTKIEKRVEKVTDTLYVDGGVVTKYKDVYVIKKDTSIVYVDKKDSTTIEAKVYEQPIKGDRSSGLAKITTTGELLDFSAVIECQDSIIEKTTVKYKDRGRLFLSTSVSSNKDISISLDWNVKNKAILSAGIGTNLITNVPYISVGVGIPIF